MKEHSKYPEFYQECGLTGACYYIPAKTRKYSESYFLEEYKAQYKKTYFEDEPNLRRLAKSRLEVLNKYVKKEQASLFEIGCAAGFFLDEAQMGGYKVAGLELSQVAANYGHKNGLDIKCCSFLDYVSKEKYDIICAFYVIEHFEYQEKVFYKMLSMLNKKGFLFLALPSMYGPTFNTNPTEWFRTHPEDHFMDYSHKSLKKLFKQLNMKVIYSKPVSYHPYRDQGWRGKLPLYVYKKLANWTCYGDTIQILAKRT